MGIEDDIIEQHPPKRSKPNLPEQVPDLLPEIITEILSRLPVKSLLQFRSVSKSWRSMITDPKFVKTHLTICSKDDEISHRKIIFNSYGKSVFKTCHLSPVMNGFTVNPMELDHPLTDPDLSGWIVGSINGLICIVFWEPSYIFLWNPSTRISKKLPDSGIKLSGGDWFVHGLGYDESTDDYKVVVILCPGLKSFATEVMVYSSRTGFWRRIGDFPVGIFLCEQGKFVNGAIHFTARQKNGSKTSKLIVSFDLANETFGELAQPNYGEGEFDLCSGVLGEYLCVVSNFYRSHTDVWMMKEYGVRESWTKLTTIPYYVNDFTKYYKYPGLLYLSKNGEILLNYDSIIVLYDLRSKAFKKPDIQNSRTLLGANTYVESLVSPFIQEVERQQ